MHILRIEHAVSDFDAMEARSTVIRWGERRSGVRAYRVLRAADDPNYALIDLDFDDQGAAEQFLAKLRELWGRVDVMRDPTARIVEVVERGQY